MAHYDVKERLNDTEMTVIAERFGSGNPYAAALDMVSAMVIILNRTRQIVFANKELITQMGFAHFSEVVGKRTGELVHCQHAFGSSLGCGTAAGCEKCSALSIVLRAINKCRSIRDMASIQRCSNGRVVPLDLELSVVPYHDGTETYFVVTMNDVRDQMRKTEMERVFFHDVLNSAGALKGYIRLLTEEIPEALVPEMEFLYGVSSDLIEIVKVQKTLSEIGNGAPVINTEKIYSGNLLNEVTNLMRSMDNAAGDRIRISSDSVNITFESDHVIVKRILINMLKNAIEASAGNDIVKAGCRLTKTNQLELWVQNPTEIPEESRSRIFGKACSTKGTGRGWGTYSMRLLGESILGGKVDFESDAEHGTRFSLVLKAVIGEECGG